MTTNRKDEHIRYALEQNSSYNSFDEQSTKTLKNRWADLGIELLYQERIGHDDKS